MEYTFTDYRETWTEECLKIICGFANNEGGAFMIGVNSEGYICGVQNVEALKEIVSNDIKTELELKCDVMNSKLYGKDVIMVNINSQQDPISYKGELYFRSGTHTIMIEDYYRTNFLASKDKNQFPFKALCEVEDLDDESFEIFRKGAIRSNQLCESSANICNKEIVERLKLIENKRMKRTAVLLFHKNPDELISGAYIKIGYFRNNSDFAEYDEIHGSLFHQAEVVTDYIYSRYLKPSITYDGDNKIETYAYPKEAVREAILNAIVHRDYTTRKPIQISIYDDRMYIINDCKIPPRWDRTFLLNSHMSYPYNPDISRTFVRGGVIPGWGVGITTMCGLCKQHGIPSPDFIVNTKSFQVKFEMGNKELSNE